MVEAATEAIGCADSCQLAEIQLPCNELAIKTVFDSLGLYGYKHRRARGKFLAFAVAVVRLWEPQPAPARSALFRRCPGPVGSRLGDRNRPD